MTPPPAEPLFFGPAERPLFGWLHRPGGAARHGLVIVSPFGYEAICAHRSLRALAEAAAVAGIATVRFDRDGTGDASGGDRDPDRVGAWLRSIDAAIELVKSAGVERVVIAGVRLGALLGATAAAGRDDVAGFVAIAPVVSGRGHVRELKILQGALGLAEPPPGAPVDPDMQEALGFVLTADTRTALGKLDLAKAPPPAQHVLVLDRDDLPAADAWVERLRTSATDVDARRFSGYVDMVLDPHKSIVPAQMIADAIAWIGALPSAPAPATAARLHAPAQVAPRVHERAVRAGATFAIVTEPAPGGATPTGRVLVFLNAGGVHHVGPNRMYVDYARHCAARGDVVLRIDQSGIGDAAPRPGEDDNVVYSRRAVDDAVDAVRFARGLPGARDVRAIGLCSGAYHAFKLAVRGEPVTGVVAINPLTFFWKEGQSLDYPAYQVARNADRYKSAITDAGKWKKVLRGEVDLKRAAETVARAAASRAIDTARDLSRRIGLPWRDDLGAELEAVAARKIDLRFVFAVGDPGLSLLRGQGGSAVAPLQKRGALHIAMIDGPDHTFTPVWTHAELARVLDDAIGAAR